MRRPSLALLLMALPACGGGGGGPAPVVPPPPSVLDGRYSFVAIGGRSVGGSVVVSQAGQMTSDGQAEVAMAASFVNQNGTLVSAAPTTASFTVDAQGIVSLVDLGGGEFRGQISDDGALMALSAASAGSTPGLLLAVRMSGAFDLSTLSDTYWVGIVIATQAPSLVSRFGTVVLDGAGSSPSFGSFTTNNNGAVLIAPGGLDTGVYSVFADGSVSYAGALGTFFGGLLDDGQVGLLAGQVAGQPALMVLVQDAVIALDNARFAGLYGTARMFFTGATELNFASLAGPSTASGVGVLTSTDLLANREGGIGAGFTRNASYLVEASGRLSLTHLAGGTAEILSGTGAIAPSGRFAFCFGNANPNDPPALEVFVRR